MRAITLAACLAVLLAACQSTATQSKDYRQSNTPAAGEATRADASTEAEPAPAPEPAPEPAEPAEPAKPAQPPDQAAPAEPAEPEGPQMGYGEGPIRIAVTAMREHRFLLMPGEELNVPESDFRMQVRLMGADMLKIKQIGNLVLTEVRDDTGHSMVDDTLYTDEERTALRRMPLPAERLAESGLLLTTKARVSSRGATKIATMKGYVRAILAEGDTRDITVLNPMQYQGQAVVSDQLAALGIAVELVELDQVAQPMRSGIVLNFTSKGEHVESVKFYDSWMREIRSRERPVQLADGETAMAYVLDTGAIDNEMQMVISVWPEIEDRMIQFDAPDTPLP